MKRFVGLLAAACAGASAMSASAADFKTLRHLSAGPPTVVSPLPDSSGARRLQFVRAVIHPPAGEPWAIVYQSLALLGDSELVSWKGGASEENTGGFKRVFDEEARRAGMPLDAGQSLFDSNDGSADLKLAVMVDELKGRFCIDCGAGTLLHGSGIPATVTMTAHWEIYSSLDHKVVAKITTAGGADYKTLLEDSYLPAVFEGFRENVRQLLASEDFRRVLVNSPGAAGGGPLSSAAAPMPISFAAASSPVPIPQAAKSVAIIYAADGAGSGFLLSGDGYVLTNQHVVGGSKYVKLKWANGAETLGEVIRADSRRDVALIKTDPQGRSPLSLRSGAVQQGETAFAIGTPLDDSLQNTMTKGIVSAERVEKGLRFIQSDVGINHGNSGGPLLDDKAAVVAIAVSGLLPDSHQMGLNFFIPIDDALKALALTPVAPPPAKAAAAKPLKRKG